MEKERNSFKKRKTFKDTLRNLKNSKGRLQSISIHRKRSRSGTHNVVEKNSRVDKTWLKI